MPAPQHRKDTTGNISCTVVTVSDTRTRETDKGGRLACDLLEQAGHRVHHREIIKDHPDEIRNALRRLLADPEGRVILFTGGTGLARRDNTCDVLVGLLEKRLDGFGELFRMLSYEQIGPAAMLSRAAAGVAGNKAVFSMPGSTGAVRLAMEKLILPELGHIVWLLEA